MARGKVVTDGTPDALAQRSRYYNAVSIVLKADRVAAVDSVVRKLSDVAGTEKIPGEEGLACIIAFPKSGRPIITDISQIARDPANAIEEVRVERGRLDEVFRNITTRQA